jgi:heme ABC exporter ATP-binding subunit CcmA
MVGRRTRRFVHAGCAVAGARRNQKDCYIDSHFENRYPQVRTRSAVSACVTAAAQRHFPRIQSFLRPDNRMNLSSTSIAIGVDRLTQKFGSRIVLNNLHLEIAAGESVSIVGANGSGKTSLLRCLAGLVHSSGGEVRWFGLPAADKPALRRLVGMVAHDGFLYPHLTARENLVFAARMYTVPNPGQRVDELIQDAGLEPYTYRQAKKLSRGLRQRFSILRALVHNPKVLILDEPFAALDTAGTDWLGSLLEKLRSAGCTLCFTTHDLILAHAHADRVLELHCGVLQVLENVIECGMKSSHFARAA